MSMQTRYGITFGSGNEGMKFEKKLRKAAELDGLSFPAWIKRTLTERADFLLTQPDKTKEKVGATE